MWEALGSIILACLAAGFLAGLLFERWRTECDEFDAQIAGYESRITENRAKSPRHARSQPRAFPSPAPAAAPPEPGRTALVRSGYRDSWRWGDAVNVFNDRRAAKGLPPVDSWGRPAKPAVTAADIAQVFLPPQPAPDKNGAEDSGLMPRVRLEVGDTGEMRAVTSAWIADNCPGAEEAIA